MDDHKGWEQVLGLEFGVLVEPRIRLWETESD
jgi:hypothetical protein